MPHSTIYHKSSRINPTSVLFSRPGTYVVTKPRSRSVSPEESKPFKVDQAKLFQPRRLQSSSPEASPSKQRRMSFSSSRSYSTMTRSSSESSRASLPFSPNPSHKIHEKDPSKADLTDLIDEHPVFESSSIRRELMVIIGSLIRF